MNYVYIQPEGEDQIYTTGFYDLDGKWQPEKDCDSKEEAAQRVAWLNGASPESKLNTSHAIVCARLREIRTMSQNKSLNVNELLDRMHAIDIRTRELLKLLEGE